MFKMGCALAKRMLVRDEQQQSDQQQQATTAAIPSTTAAASKAPQQATNQVPQQQQQLLQQQPQQQKRSASIDDFSKLVNDPRMPLDKRQIFKITKSWKAIARAMSKTGTIMFVKLFEQNHNLLDLFTRFQHLKGASRLEDSMELQEHAATVMSTLDQSINTLSNYDNLVCYLHSIGELHKKVPNFKSEYFWEIEQPFLNAVKITLDERFNENIEKIYQLTIKLIIETIIEGFGQQTSGAGSKTDDKNNNNITPGNTTCSATGTTSERTMGSNSNCPNNDNNKSTSKGSEKEKQASDTNQDQSTIPIDTPTVNERSNNSNNESQCQASSKCPMTFRPLAART